MKKEQKKVFAIINDSELGIIDPNTETEEQINKRVEEYKKATGIVDKKKTA